MEDSDLLNLLETLTDCYIAEKRGESKFIQGAKSTSASYNLMILKELSLETKREQSERIKPLAKSSYEVLDKLYKENDMVEILNNYFEIYEQIKRECGE